MRAATFGILALNLTLLLATTSCHLARPRTFLPRKGDEIVVAGQFFHTGTRVVTWMDPRGYDGYRVERRFSTFEDSGWDKTKAQVKDIPSPNRYGLRRDGLSDAEVERLRGGGWDLLTLQGVVDQFVMHYDVAGTSKQCFKVLHDMRGLSVHFMLDVDGTIYQTVDLKERTWHATSSNTRSIGIEIANVGAYPPALARVLDEWYPLDEKGMPYLKVPERLGDPMFYTKDFVGRPARAERVRGTVQGTELVQYDLTPQQYDALVKLTAALCKVFPKITCDYPRDAAGKLIAKKLPDDELKAYHGVLGHFHVQTNKTDPGPAFDWNRVIGGARRLLHLPEVPVETKKGGS
ncbi:MAG: N-acetylmuramoyl-L-alanine amidase [Verrucomicrobiota bacterium]